VHRLTVLIAAACLVYPAATAGAVGAYAFDGGTKKQRETVIAALDASSFDWSSLRVPITTHIVRGGPSQAIPREIWLDADLLDSGEFAWGAVQHEFAHQVDYLLLDDAQRALLLQRLGGRDWCYAVAGLPHDEYGCERFASTFAWSFWPSKENSMRPTHRGDESAAMAPAQFRLLITRLLGRPVARWPVNR
jgi:hypothetical protein